MQRSDSPHNSRRPTSPRRIRPQEAPKGPGNEMRIAYIVISGLVVCSMLAVAVMTVDLSGLWGNGDDDVIVDPNADLIADQETVVAENPDDADEVLLLANMLAQAGRMNEAMRWYQRAIDLSPEDMSVRLDFARSLQKSGLHQDAEAQFLRVLETNPDSQPGHYYLGQLYMEWRPQRRAEAREHFERALEINPDSFLGGLAKTRLDTLEHSPSRVDSTPVGGP